MQEEAPTAFQKSRRRLYYRLTRSGFREVKFPFKIATVEQRDGADLVKLEDGRVFRQVVTRSGRIAFDPVDN